MKNLYSFVVLLFLILGDSGVRAQECTYTMSMFSQLGSAQTDSESATLGGHVLTQQHLTSILAEQVAYPSDMMVYIYAPNGNCVVWGDGTSLRPADAPILEQVPITLGRIIGTRQSTDFTPTPCHWGLMDLQVLGTGA